MSRVLVVEDEPAIAELVSLNLRHAGYEVTIAATGEQALAAVDGVLPDLVILDWMLPGTSGQALARRWRGEERTRHLPIIMLTARADEADKVAGLDAGADDYLTKPFSTNELMARIRAVLRRKAPEALDTVVEAGPLKLDPATRRVTRDEREVKVGPTEFRLLHFLMTHPERVHSRAQLLDRVWGDHVFIEERTVDVHVKRLREALDAAVEVGGLRLDPTTRRVTRAAPGGEAEARVGPTEFRLLHFLMTHPERVHSRAQLLDRVWGDHVFIEERTVDVHVKRLREALAPGGCAAMIETVRGAGYRLTQNAPVAMG